MPRRHRGITGVRPEMRTTPCLKCVRGLWVVELMRQGAVEFSWSKSGESAKVVNSRRGFSTLWLGVFTGVYPSMSA